jgi:hypothetical protein
MSAAEALPRRPPCPRVEPSTVLVLVAAAQFMVVLEDGADARSADRARESLAGRQGQRLRRSGLIGLLVFIAGIALLFANRCPRGLYAFIMGMNRWCFRVVAYAALMTDRYPPFRMDMGDREPPPADVVTTAGPDPLPAS